MGLSSKEVSGDHNDQLDWTRTLLSGSDGLELPKPRPTRRQLVQLQQPEPLKCPRCESTNTKFCYYNNYNKSQPRHFCKSCKRHWTNGGTLRNVPVGGGRKNKRLKRPSGNTTSAAAAAATAIQSTDSYLGTYDFSHIQEPKPKMFNEKPIECQKVESYVEVVDGLDGQNTWDMMSTGGFMGCTTQLPQNPCLGFSLLSSSFDINPSSILSSSLSSMNGYDKFTSDTKIDNTEDSTITTTTMIAPSSREPQLILPNSTNCFMEMPSYWNWNVDVDNLVLADLNKPWDDSEFKS